MALTDFRNALDAKKEEIAERHQPQEIYDPQENAADMMALSEVLHLIGEVGSTYIEDYFVCAKALKRPMFFHIRIPPPAFFFMEHGSPFILHSLALPPRPNPKVPDTPRQVFERQVRTCCVSIVNPKLTIDFLSRLPRYFIQYLYAFIIDLIAPPEAVNLLRAFVNKCKSPEDRMSILEIYLMSGKNYQATTEYLFPKIKNPYIKGSLQHIIFEIGFERDRKEKQTEINAMSGSAMRRGFFG